MSDTGVHIDVFDQKTKEVVSLPIEDIIKSMILKKLNNYYEYEMYKVLAIVYRTIVMRKLEIDKESINLEDCELDEGNIKLRFGNNHSRYIKMADKAIKETKGLIIAINNLPINAFIHDNCGGSTENSENIINNKVTYLRRVLCDHCANSPNRYSESEFTVNDLEKNLNVKFPNKLPVDIDMKDFIENIEKDETGRVIKLTIGGKEFKGTEIVDLLGINSTRFTIYPQKIIIKAVGKGDGLGICMFGANEMARTGCSYKDIINYYYTGVEVKELLRGCIKKPLKGKVIIVDPGHGGCDCEDNIGRYGAREKDLVLNISLILYEKLKELGAEVFLTRDSDEFISLSKRSKLSNKIRPDFFLSIHLNSFGNESVRGCEIYHYRNDKKASLLSGYIMKSIQNELDIPNKGIKTADFYLLREVGNTCIHIELDYISNPDVEIRLCKDEYVKKVAECIKDGILNYYKA